MRTIICYTCTYNIALSSDIVAMNEWNSKYSPALRTTVTLFPHPSYTTLVYITGHLTIKVPIFCPIGVCIRGVPLYTLRRVYVPGSGFVDGDVGEREKVCPHNLEQLKLLLTGLTQFPLQLWEGEEGGGCVYVTINTVLWEGRLLALKFEAVYNTVQGHSPKN